MSPSATCTVNSYTLPLVGETGIDVLPSSTITVALADVAGVLNWSINCTSSDGINPNSAYTTINSTKIQDFVHFTATFVMPALYSKGGLQTGGSMQFTSTVNAGEWNENTITFGVFVLGTLGIRLIFNDETEESNTLYGVNQDINRMLAFQGSTGITGIAGPQGPTGAVGPTGAAGNIFVLNFA